MPTYVSLNHQFHEKGYTVGNCLERYFESDLPLGRVPTRDKKDYLIKNLSGSHDEYIQYVSARPDIFDKQFFKDCIASHYYALEFEKNIFEWMADEFIDEELVMCAMIRAINMRYVDRRGECDDWFYSVYKRRPDLLTYDMYVLGARCFARKLRDGNRFLTITPDKYRTEEYYAALCMMNSSPVTEDIPAEILTDGFLIGLINASAENVKCFTEEILERELPMQGMAEKVKVWQAIVMLDGYLIRDIPLNEERIEFFLSHYDKDSGEYEYGFKRNYKIYLRKKNGTKAPDNSSTELAAMMSLFGAMSGMSGDEAIDLGSEFAQNMTNRKTGLPISMGPRVPKEFAKKYDKEEYLLEIYKKLGIQVLGERDYYYYDVILPEGATVNRGGYGKYCLKIGDEVVVEYRDVGPFYDRSVEVCSINCTL
ncbi:hypothetical protein J5500_02845 [Candidatus Saccharibacteria bacterium]|nr:hypothetical protein [Candidatus Saccharibacteria bacterium]